MQTIHLILNVYSNVLKHLTISIIKKYRTPVNMLEKATETGADKCGTGNVGDTHNTQFHNDKIL